MYRGKECTERFIEHIEVEKKRLDETLSQKLMTELTDLLKREHQNSTKLS